MSAPFISKIEVNETSSWQIRIIDVLEKKEVVCYSIDEYALKIEEMGEDYGSDIEVSWQRDENLSIKQFNEIEKQMKKYQEELKQNENI
jgi:hypothetical protein